jgi:hypothetical protein
MLNHLEKQHTYMTYTFPPGLFKSQPVRLAIAAAIATAAFALPAANAQAQSTATAQQGLDKLLKQPWNHELRLSVAESLVREGRIGEAISQLEALQGTSQEQVAEARIRQLKSGGLQAQALPQVQPRPQVQAQVQSPAQPPIQAATQPVAPASIQPQALPTLPTPPVPPKEATYLPVRPQPPVRVASASTPAQAIGQDNSPVMLRQLPQFQYVAPGSAVEPSPSEPTPRIPGSLQGKTLSSGAQEIIDLMAAGNYKDAGTKGLALIGKEKVDDEIRVMVANSLAWTGRLKEASTLYASVKSGAAAQDAEVGLANIERWQGRDDLAARRYRKVLASDPEHAGASEGLALALRELRPRTIFNAGRSKDSADVQRDAGSLTHRWSNSDGSSRYEVEASAVRDRSPAAAEREQAVTLRYSAPTLSLKPSFELSVPNRDERTVFGGARATVGDATFEVARVNWGKMAVTPQALAAGLSANHVGVEWRRNVDIGNISARLAYYDISDSNTIWTSALQLTSSWRPLGSHFKPFVGMETREARFNTPQYWSPAIGFGTAYAGLMGEWGAADWNLFGSAQAGTRLYGDAGTSWSVSTGGKRWIGDDVGVGFALWSMASQRDNARYRASSANFTVEKIW